jgi:glutathione S-transferase
MARNAADARKHMTLAHCALGTIITRRHASPIEHPPHAALRAWREKYAARPAFKKAVAG